MELKVGMSYTKEITVEDRHTAKAFASGILDVFATPMLAAITEEASMRAVADALEEGQGTVGISLDLKHIAATPVGGHVRATATLTAIDRRKLTFEIEAYDDKELIGTCTHERFIIDNEKFMAKVSSICC